MFLADPFVNIGQTASLYSQIAGVLAGFAFTVLVTFLGRSTAVTGSTEAEQRAERGAIASVLFSTLAALIICAVLYGILAGAAPESGNAQSGLLLYGPAFSLAVLSMFYATGLAALPFEHLTAMLDVVRVLVCVSSPALSTVLVAGAANDICETTPGRCVNAPALDPVHPFGFGLVLAVLVALISGTALHRHGRKTITAGSRAALANAVTWIVLTTALAAGILAVTLDLKPAGFVVSHWALYLVVALTATLLQTFALLAMHSLRPRRSPTGAGQDRPDSSADFAVESARGNVAHRNTDPSRRKAGMTQLTHARVSERLQEHLINHYAQLHSTLVSITLGAAGYAAAGLATASGGPLERIVVSWLLWVGALLAVSAAYLGVTTGVFLLPAQIPATVDLILPLAIGLCQFMLFGVLTPAVAAFRTTRSLLIAWLIAMAAFALSSLLGILRARYVIAQGQGDSDIQRVLTHYHKRLTADAKGVFALLALSVIFCIVAGAMKGEPWGWYVLFCALPTASLAFGVVRHEQAARFLRAALLHPAPSAPQPSAATSPPVGLE